MTVDELCTFPIFRNLAPEDLEAMLGCLSAREISPRRGDFIMRSPGEHPLMGVVLEGEVEMISEDYFGKKSLLTVLPAGSIFGESYTCVKARNRTIAYQARTHCRVLLLDYERILHACKLVCRFHHRMIENMVELIAEKNLVLVEKLEVVSRTTIREKLLTYLAPPGPGRRQPHLYRAHQPHRPGRVPVHRPGRHDPGAGPDEGGGAGGL